MARNNPFGVGVGDWQTHYPVYRVHNRGLAFDGVYQVRRAHSDHVQFLGEAGWPGLGLWLLSLWALIAEGVRGWRRGGRVGALLMTAQIAAVIAAMGLDYVLEHPYGKLQFVLTVFLTLSASSVVGSSTQSPGTMRPGLRTIVSVMMLAVALLNVLYFVAFSRKIIAGAHLTRDYLRAMPQQNASSGAAASPAIDLGRLQQVVSRGRDFAVLPGHTKAMFRDYVLLADSAYRAGRLPAAEVYLTRSLALHPHNPPSFRLAARLQMDPGARRQWEVAAEFIMDEATEGYSRAYPPGHPLARKKKPPQPPPP
jgi:hypothetical protein